MKKSILLCLSLLSSIGLFGSDMNSVEKKLAVSDKLVTLDNRLVKILENTPYEINHKAFESDIDSVCYLLKFSILHLGDLNFKNEDGNTALHFAAMYNSKKLVDALILAKKLNEDEIVDISIKNSMGQTAKDIAEILGFNDIVAALSEGNVLLMRSEREKVKNESECSADESECSENCWENLWLSGLVFAFVGVCICSKKIDFVSRISSWFGL